MIIKHPIFNLFEHGVSRCGGFLITEMQQMESTKKMSSGVNTKHSVVVITYLTYYNPDIYIHIWLNYYYFLLTFTVKTL